MINYRNFIKEVKENIEKVVDSGDFILGSQVHKLEEEIARYVGVKYAIGLNSCTDALVYSLKSLGIGREDEVLCPSYTFVSTASAVVWAGAKPVFCDINEKTFNMDVDGIEKMITPKTKAVIPVHLYGQSADMMKIKTIAQKHKLKIIEDNAQAFGAEYKNKKIGGIGDIGCLSFFPSKILGTFGDGGMILTNNTSLAKNIKMMRIDGASDVKKIYYSHKIVGSSSRLHEIQAAILRTKFKYIKENLAHRKKIAEIYRNRLKGVGDLILPVISKNNKHVYNSFIIKTLFRDKLRRFLTDQSIKTEIAYPVPLHMFESFSFLKNKKGDFPMAEKVSKQVLGLPINEFLSIAEVENVIVSINKFFNNLNND